MLYYDFDNDGLVDFPDGTSSGIKENNLQACWWDGFSWRISGSSIDVSSNTVTVKTTHFSIYALFPKETLFAQNYRPKERTITPASPQFNDVAHFDAQEGNDFKIMIYDIEGRKVRDILPPQLPQWDGKDEHGSFVESGVYLYQFEAEIEGRRKTISGTITVAK